jgi:hypothetical protein
MPLSFSGVDAAVTVPIQKGAGGSKQGLHAPMQPDVINCAANKDDNYAIDGQHRQLNGLSPISY